MYFFCEWLEKLWSASAPLWAITKIFIIGFSLFIHLPISHSWPSSHRYTHINNLMGCNRKKKGRTTVCMCAFWLCFYSFLTLPLKLLSRDNWQRYHGYYHYHHPVSTQIRAALWKQSHSPDEHDWNDTALNWRPKVSSIHIIQLSWYIRSYGGELNFIFIHQ